MTTFCGLLLWLLPIAAANAVQIACPPGSNPACLPGFPVEFSGGGIPSDIGSVIYSSPAVARLGIVADNAKDIVVGTTSGYVIAYHANGSYLWSYKVQQNASGPAIPVHTKPAIADLDGDGVPEVVVGAGWGLVVGGGVYILRNNGTLKCAFTALDPTFGGWGVASSPAVASLDRTRPNEKQIVFGSFDIHIRAIRPDCTVWWDKQYSDGVTDTVWSSPAIYDLDGDGQLDVVIGHDSDQVGGQWINGGMVRAFRGNGVGELPGFPILLNEVVYSSPAIGDIIGTGQPIMTVGNGRCWDIAACAPNGIAQPVTEAAFAWRANGTALAGWPYAMPSQSARLASPALADLDGDGKLETVINTLIKTNGPDNDVNGYMHVIRSNGTAYPGWPVQPNLPVGCDHDVHYGSQSSPVVFDMNGDGVLEIAQSIGPEIVVWSRSGQQLSKMISNCTSPTALSMRVPTGAYNTPTIADLLGDGHLSLVVGATASGSNPGALYAWKFPNSVASAKNMPWPQFRHDALNTGVYVGDLIFRNGFD